MKLVFLCVVAWLQLQRSVQDINECKVLPNACHKDAYCYNYDGYYNCICVSGYSGNGTVCSAPEKCQAPLDLIFLLDASGSVGKGNYVKEKEFIKIVASRYDLEITNQAAVIVFSDQASNEIPLGSKKTALSFAVAVDNIPYAARSTRIDLALRMAYDEYFSTGSSNGTQKLVILLTDGIQTKRSRMTPPYIPIEGTVQLLRSKAARIFAVAIGSGVKLSEMRTVTEKDDDIFLVKEFNDLVTQADSISKTSCVDALETQGITVCSADPEMTNCNFPAHCVNTSRKHVSCVCITGFVGVSPHCEDIDECADGSHDCHVTSYCVNTAGSYNCSCNQSGYSYNGSMCVGMLP
ncbi:hypothetical protein OS493_021724 [Desmophyllum pertusum]|uniref:Uncharacterized protein n=1 Tax=Desmophyllum pertusum TaxID=174260 RepID=A0A9W9YB37_9CNID|nr:hypothetical protein OS493_021724 [Desmophyllum pertusum]